MGIVSSLSLCFAFECVVRFYWDFLNIVWHGFSSEISFESLVSVLVDVTVLFSK